jgi:glycosyltransferase involved in cell wall biosynthesis
MTSEHFKPILRWVAVFMGNRFADAIICNSQATAAAYLAAGGRPGKVTVVYDGVSPDPFDAAAKDTEFKQNLRSELAVPPGAPLIGLFGRLSEWKGQHILLEALAALPEAHGMLVGDALFGEQDYVQRLRERADRPDLAGRIHFLGFRHDIPELMVSTDVVVHTSTAPEPLGLVIVEGLLARRPVIATAGGGAMEVIIDGESGILVRPGEPAALLNALRLLLADPVMAERLSAAGRNRAESLFSVKAVISGIGDVVDRFGRP